VAAWNHGGTIEASYQEGYAPAWMPTATLGEGSQPQVVVTPGGNAIVAWLDGSVRATLRPVASGTWLPAVAISADGASDFRLRGNGAGAEVHWSRAGQVEAAQLDGTGPLVSKIDGSPDGLIGDNLPFAVQALPWASPLAETTWTFGDGASATGQF